MTATQIETPPPFRKFKNGRSYSPNTPIVKRACLICGSKFIGATDKYYCGAGCRAQAAVRRAADKLRKAEE